MVRQNKRCPNCLNGSVSRDAANCPSCGHAFTFRPAPARRTAELTMPEAAVVVAAAPHDVSSATMASLFMIGSGQSYNGQTAKGTLLFVLSAVFYGLGLWRHSAAFTLLGVGVWLVSIIDAAVVAGWVLERREIGKWDWFWARTASAGRHGKPHAA